MSPDRQLLIYFVSSGNRPVVGFFGLKENTDGPWLTSYVGRCYWRRFRRGSVAACSWRGHELALLCRDKKALLLPTHTVPVETKFHGVCYIWDGCVMVVRGRMEVEVVVM